MSYLSNPATIFIYWSLLICARGLAQEADFLTPDQIDYSGAPGYQMEDGRSLEWSESSLCKDGVRITASLKPAAGLRLRWLGTAGYEISDDNTTLLIDPFLSRPRLTQIFRPMETDTAEVEAYLWAHLDRENLKAILISHAHYDHVMDVPYILSHYPRADERPVVVGDANVAAIIHSYTPESRATWAQAAGGLGDSPVITVAAVDTGIGYDVGKFGEFSVRAFVSTHPKYQYFPSRGPEGEISGAPPFSATGYRSRNSVDLTYLIEYRGLRLYFTETPVVVDPASVGRVDILIQGIAARKPDDTIARTIAHLQPRFVIPTHYDNFFRPVSSLRSFDYDLGVRLRIPFSRKYRFVVDFSQFEQFITQFDVYYVPQARKLIGSDGEQFNPKLRLMKLLYYYSLESLILKE